MKDNTELLFKPLVDFAVAFSADQMSEEQKQSLRLLMLDYYAALSAGYRINAALNEPVSEIILAMGGKEESVAAFSKKKIPAVNAALLNGCYSRGAEMDDGHRRSNSHTYSTVIPSVFALAETLEVTEDEVMAAAAVGFEAVIRLGNAIMPWAGERGFHPTCVAGAVGSAIACAKLLKLKPEQYYTAIAAAALQANGIKISQNMGPLAAGKAAQTAVISALLAAKGARGDRKEAEDCNKWFDAVAGEYDASAITEDMDGKLMLQTGYIKLYPACRHIHAAIDLGVSMHGRFDPLKADRILISLYPMAMKVAGGHIHPENAAEARFSTAYAVSCAMLKGSFTLDDLDVGNVSQDIYDLCEKIEFEQDDALVDREKGYRGARIQVWNGDEHIVETVMTPKGEPENPVSWKDVEDKFEQCAADTLSPDVKQKIISRVRIFGTDRRFEAIIV